MKTYLNVWFNSNGESPSVITDKLRMLGFQPIQGNYDFFYDWAKGASTEDIVLLADKIQKVLKGAGVLFKLETI